MIEMTISNWDWALIEWEQFEIAKNIFKVILAGCIFIKTFIFESVKGPKACQLCSKLNRLREECKLEFDEILTVFLTSYSYSSSIWPNYRKSLPNFIPYFFHWSKADKENLPEPYRRWDNRREFIFDHLNLGKFWRKRKLGRKNWIK